MSVTTRITTRDVHVTYPDFSGNAVTIPAGTEVMRVNDGWAVRSVKRLEELTGNTHDPKYRYCWVPEDAVLQPAANVDPDIERGLP